MVYIFLQMTVVSGAVYVEFSSSALLHPSVRVNIEESRQFRSVSFTEEPEEDSKVLGSPRKAVGKEAVVLLSPDQTS